MANQVNIAGLGTLNPKEVQNISDFLVKNMLENPKYSSFFGKVNKVTMQQKIGLVTSRRVSGLLDASCTRPTSVGPLATFTEKVWNPKKIADSFFNCTAELDGLFKPYFDKVNEYRDLYDIRGSDLEVMLSGFLLNTMEQTILRLAFLGDTTLLPAPGPSNYGIVTGGEAAKAHYDIIDGIWKQLFTIVAATPTQRITITENNNSTLAAQTTLATGVAKGYLDAMYNASNPYLRASTNQVIFATDALFMNYAIDLRLLDANVIGSGAYKDALLPTLTYNGIPVINVVHPVGFAINTDLQKSSVQATARYLPNRFLWTTLDNLQLATLNEADFGKITIDYNERTSDLMLAYGFTLDAKVMDDNKIMVAY